MFFELVTMVSRLKHPTKSLSRKVLAMIYIALKILLVMVYLEDDTDQEKAIPFILIFSIKGLIDVTINHRLFDKKISPKLLQTIKLLFLNPLMLYFGYHIMNNYIKRYAEGISYE